jgi:hypothetical protein
LSEDISKAPQTLIWLDFPLVAPKELLPARSLDGNQASSLELKGFDD